ncbi:hypothetical protein QUC31_009776 [Theobroma cacao]|uniref:Neurofilament medium polypeptide n=2 Tax=Theobroma cacao TaxID=3641 RepID=A0AB32V5Z1_THECC|nr:PREDICTED: neurofilament medium polypeptide [Theobroma cacao]EOY10880.1 Uncharacterized protein TCM_026173 isoform 1 [Theobroma cacao]
MGCFFACFSASKNKKHQHLVDGTFSNDHQKGEAIEAIQSTKEEDFKIPFDPIAVKKEKLGELLNYSGKKKVTFDLNVRTHDEELPAVSSDKLLKNHEDEESKETAEGSRSPVLYLTTSNEICKSQNDRYQNSAESEDELEDVDLEVSDLDDDNEDGKAENEPQLVIEESSESLFSLSIESRKQVCEVESEEKEVTSPMPVDKSPIEEVKPTGLNRNGKDKGAQYVQSVLNPVENLAQWKEVKSKAGMPLKQHEKENFTLEQEFHIPVSPEPSFKFTTFSSKLCSKDNKPVGQETAVDTSLSSWLVEPENTPNSKASTNSVGNSASKKTNSPRSHEDRPILGALTMEELKQHSASTSPRKRRSQSPDETPIIGTVGSYWSHTGQTINSDSSFPSKGTPRTRSRNMLDERLKWNAIPFEARLERDLKREIKGV